MPNLSISKPPKNSVVPFAVSFPVEGQVTDVGMPEPQLIASVTIQVDDGPVSPAGFHSISNKNLTVVKFNGSGIVSGGSDPHLLKVTATDDLGISVQKTVVIFTGTPFEVSAPAIQLEISPTVLSSDRIDKLASDIQKNLVSASQSLSSIGLTLAGPNVVVGFNPRGGGVHRIGLWIVGPTFPLLPPSPPDFPLPRLSDAGALAGFDSVPFLSLPPVPNPPPLVLSFGILVPTSALQGVADAGLAKFKNAASGAGITLESFTVACSGGSVTGGSVTATLVAHPNIGVGSFSATITEILGVAPGSASPRQLVPNIVASLSSSTLPPPFSEVFSLAAGLVGGIVETAVRSIPASVPFRNKTALAVFGNFPLLVPMWTRFGTTSSGILGTGTALLQTRDQTMVAMTLSGPGLIGGSQSDLSGGAQESYSLTWANLVPDPDQFEWQVTTPPSNNIVDRGFILLDPSAQHGDFVVNFPLPSHVKPGPFHFSLAVQATETSELDPTQTLTSPPTAMRVTVVVKKDALHGQ